MRRLSMVLLASAALATPAAANVLGAGGFGSPDPFGTVTGTVLATTTLKTVTSSGSPNFTASYEEEVLRDTITGHLDFVLYLKNISAANGDDIGRATLSNFTGFTTDVGTAGSATGLPAGGVYPVTLVTRGNTGDDIGFDFLGSGLPPGVLSPILAVKTNASQFTAGDISFIDGGITTVAGFEPSAVPLPAALPLLLTGFAGLGGLGAVKKWFGRKGGEGDTATA